MSTNLRIMQAQNSQKLLIDDKVEFIAKTIASAKFYDHNRMVAVIFTSGMTGVAFLALGKSDKDFVQSVYEFVPQPLNGMPAVLEISPGTDLPFVHYSVEDGNTCIVTQNGILGIFNGQEAERLLKHMREEIWNFCVVTRTTPQEFKRLLEHMQHMREEIWNLCVKDASDR